ncbi:F-box protein At5g07610-like [Aegilops tauschii subsp. strangulata]|uniref:F-box protein At5g07610-like n=1 Tax=Aegilops tauschii subsp. strangulata TaxID=200361 RepID=UPI003CC847F4
MDVANGNDGAAANGVCFPYDVLLNVLRRLPRRALARSRRVCRAWRAIVDAHALLVPHSFPRGEFPGVYANYFLSSPRSAFFAPPPPRSGVDPAARFRRPIAWNDLVLDPHVWRDWGYVQRHCNGLLLVRDRCKFEYVNHVHVCNPATMWRARLPSPPKPWPRGVQGMFLAFDPAVSRHHEVFMFPQNKVPSVDNNMAISLPVFSSRTGRWENRRFAPGRCAPVHLYDAAVTEPCSSEKWIWSAEYWRGSLYVHVHSGVLVILRCSGSKYDMVELPKNDPPANHDTEEQHEETPKPRKGSILANHEGGVRYVVLNKYRLLVEVELGSREGCSEYSWNPDKHNFIQLLDGSSVVADDLDNSELWYTELDLRSKKIQSNSYDQELQ